MVLTPSDVGLILGYRCQAACQHCIYNCGPGWQDWMSLERLQEGLRALAAWPRPVQVHITGGEPFLKFDLLLEAVRLATELGIPCYLETNAGWCVSEDLVTRRLVALRDAGLQAALISCSPFHAETIPTTRTRLALAKALEILGPGRVILYQSEWLAQPEWLAQTGQFGMGETVTLESYVEHLGADQAGQLLWQGFGLMGGGRSGYRLGHLVARKAAQAFRGQNCLFEILYAHHSHMDLYGNYIPGFCGGLTSGDWHDLPQIRTRFQAGRYPPLLEILIQDGPLGLFEMAQEHYGYTSLRGGYADKCHLCVDVRRTLVERDSFPELEPRAFYGAF